MHLTIHTTINNKEFSFSVEPQDRLVDLLRNVLHLTGTKVGCRIGECGVCSVIMDGKLVASCLVPAVQADRSHITTIEYLSKNGQLGDLQEAFIEEGAIQCGYCTPGMVLAGESLLQNNPNPTVKEIQTAIAGNLCRCTGYKKIVSAIERTAHQRTKKIETDEG